MENDTISFQEGLKLLRNLLRGNDDVMPIQNLDEAEERNTTLKQTTQTPLGTTTFGKTTTDDKMGHHYNFSHKQIRSENEVHEHRLTEITLPRGNC